MARQRNIEINITGNLPIDGYKAALQRVQDYERQIEEGRTVKAIDSVGGDPAVRIVASSLSQYEVYVFDITDLDPDAGVYSLTLVSIGM